MFRRPLSLLVTIALVATPGAATPPLPVPPPRPPAVVCNDRVDYEPYPNVVVTGTQAVPAPMVMPSPPPPPPPAPPPPPQASTIATKELRKTVPVGRALTTVQLLAPGNAQENRERYVGKEVGAAVRTAEAPVSTFAVDVDTASYANSRRMLLEGHQPPAEAVRTEEFLNYFRYDYAKPANADRPFSVSIDAAKTPWNPETRLLRVGLKGYDVARTARPAANLVFLVDVSGSMQSADKLDLVKTALSNLADQLNPQDRVSIVVYAGAPGVVLNPTHDKNAVKAALDCMSAGGSTAGGQGIKLAYDVARKSFLKDGINRIILCTDGDFNVGVSSDAELKKLVKEQRDSGITLTALGFGTGNYNDAMMETIADVGNGNYGYVDSAMEARKLLDEELSSTLFTIAQDVKVQVEFNPAVIAEYRLIGYENRALREQDFANDTVDAGDIGAGHQVTALYEVVPAGAKGWLADRRYPQATPAAAKLNEAAMLKLRYKLPGEKQSRLIEQPVPAAMIGGAGAPHGDLAFATSVAAFGQKLRGDPDLARFSYADIRSLAGSGGDYWRQEFVKLVSLARSEGATTGRE